MECIEARALKASFLSQMAMKATSHQAFYNDEGWCLTGVPSEDFPVEDLLNLDFSDKEFQDAAAGLFKEDQDSNKGGSNNSSSTFSGADDFDSLSSGNLHVPVEEDLDNLEWLSQFADDSTAAEVSLFPIGNFPSVKSEAAGAAVDERAFVPPPAVPRKSRSKRERSNGQSWSLTSPQLSSVDSSTASSSSYTSTSLPILLYLNTPPAAAQEPDWFSTVEKPPPTPAKKPKRKPEPESGGVSGRRCTHCQVQKTPQWRTGPLGPKTLCNACGVRFKSGRLFPEYRPACSPTFSHEVHSNSHRKVLEMRRKKETVTAEEEAAGSEIDKF